MTQQQPWTKKRRWLELCRTVDDVVEALWKPTLSQLRGSLPNKQPKHHNVVHSEGNIHLPDFMQQTLELGPEFAVEPTTTRPELLSLVRNMAKPASEQDFTRCVSEGVDAISRAKVSSSSLPLNRAGMFLQDNSLALLPADKEGGFLVLPFGHLKG